MKKIIVKISMALLILTNIDCIEKKPVYPDLKINFDPEGLKYVQLTPGKYLIYKDSASGILDSVVVGTSMKSKRYEPATTGTLSAHPGYYLEEYNLTLMKVSTGVPQIWFYGKTADSRWGTYTASTNAGEIDMRDASNQSVFNYPACVCSYQPVILPSITIEGKAYTNVVRVFSWNGITAGMPGFLRSTVYWAQRIGIIKWAKEVGTTANTYTLLEK